MGQIIIKFFVTYWQEHEQVPLSIIPDPGPKLKCHLFENSYPDSSDHPPSESKLHHSYSVSSDPLAIGTYLTMDYPLNNPFDSSPRSWISWCLVCLAFQWRF